MSDQLAVMNAGRVEQVGTPEDIYLRPRTRFVAGFLGAVNWIGEAGLRPEVDPDQPSGRAAAACWRPAVVTGSVFLGNCVHVMARLESGEEAVAEVPRELAPFQKGDAVEICWHAARRDEVRVNRLRTWFLVPAWIWLWVLFVAPFAIVLAYSLLTRGPYGGLTTPWTLENYAAPGRSAVRGDPAALVRDGRGGHGAVPGAGLSAGAIHFARRTAQESVSATGDSALLDQLPGAHLRVAVPAARYRPGQYACCKHLGIIRDAAAAAL